MKSLSEISEGEIFALSDIYNKDVKDLESLDERITSIMDSLRQENLTLHDVFCGNVARVFQTNAAQANGIVIGACYILDLIKRRLELEKLEEEI